MVLFATIVALLIEQAHPLPAGNRVHGLFAAYCEWLRGTLDAGEARNGCIAWLLAVGPLILAGLVGSLLAHHAGALVLAVFNVAVLYLTMGFRQFSHAFTAITEALRLGDAAKAREVLGQWRRESAGELRNDEVAKLAIEEGLVASHRHVFGVLAWFIVFGAAGALAYRGAVFARSAWFRSGDAEAGAFGRFAADAFAWMDWLPVRLTAASFAVVGDFEDALYCWRTQAVAWSDRAHGIVLAAGAGALGVRLGGVVHRHGTADLRPDIGLGSEADVDAMAGVVGMLWRALLLWLALLALVTVARWFA